MDSLRLLAEQLASEGGETIRLARRIIGLDHDDLARRLGGSADAAQLEAMELGEVEPDLDAVAAMTRTLSIVVPVLRALNGELHPMEVFLTGVRARRDDPQWGIVRRASDGRASIG